VVRQALQSDHDGGVDRPGRRHHPVRRTAPGGKGQDGRTVVMDAEIIKALLKKRDQADAEYWPEKRNAISDDIVDILTDIFTDTDIAALVEAGPDRVVVLPCAVGSTVYTIEEDYYPCHTCEAIERGRFEERDACYNEKRDLSNDKNGRFECPLVLHVRKHRCTGFTVGGEGGKQLSVSGAGEWGYEGHEEFYGADGKQYYSEDEAEKALEQAYIDAKMGKRHFMNSYILTPEEAAAAAAALKGDK
jgi:hypothetical protein